MPARFTAWKQPRFAGLIAVAAVTLAGVSAQAGLTVYDQAKRGAVAAAAPPPTGYEADDHFPGAALLLASEPPQPAIVSAAAPAPGSTGTAPLPDLPPPPPTADASIVAAKPFRLAGTALDQARALQCLTTAIYYEAANEPDDGQRAVAQVVLNRVRHPAFAATVCGVVFQGSERAGCQFSFACDGAMARVPAASAWKRAGKVAAAALAGSVFARVGLATHYHTYAVRPAWNRSLVMTGAFGAHFFHRWMGGWGTAPAFSQRYAGHEPVPGPHTPVVMPPVLASAATPISIFGTPAALPPVSASVDTTPRARPVPPLTGEHAASGEVLDRWKDAGKPLK